MITDELAAIVRDAIAAAVRSGDLVLQSVDVQVDITPPRSKQFGDYSSNVAMALSKEAKMPPWDVAERLIRHLPTGEGLIDRVETAGPGFMNFYLKPDWLHDVLLRIETEGSAYGHSTARCGEKVLIEFVSANPTGPISVVNGRAAALGDSLRNLLQACGAEVSSEFYVNDALNSTQLNLLGDSLAARYMQQLGHDAPLPEGGYLGDYVVDMAREVVDVDGDTHMSLEPSERSLLFRKMAADGMVEQQRRDLAAFGVEFDQWFYESSLYDKGAVGQAIVEMKQRGHAYERDGALWLRTTELVGDDQDRVLVRSNERETYVAADAAYHKGKFDRGYTRLINIWGADHHGYVARLKAGIAALGCDPKRCEIILTQMVLLMREGEPVRGSKRAGDIIPLLDLVQEVGKDAARYYFLLNSYETTSTFDLGLATKQSADNPVYYAQYAHARCASVLRKAEETGVTVPPASDLDRALLTHPRELDLLRKLADYPGEVRVAAELLAPHRLTTFIREVGQALHQFYEECPALKEGVDPAIRSARLAVFRATGTVVSNLLGLLGVSAPERM